MQALMQLLLRRAPHRHAAPRCGQWPAWSLLPTAGPAAARCSYAQLIGAPWQRERQRQLHQQLQQQHGRPDARTAAMTQASTGAASDTGAAAAVGASGGGQRPRIIVITGPTAVGKTQLSLQLAKAIGGEVISADSVQVYRGLDVGSDKLPVEQRQGIPHHLIDILPPGAEFSAGDFHQLGRAAAADIISRGKVPIVVGGTGFYLRWFILGRPSTPASSPEARTKVLQLIGQAWVQAAAEVAAGQQQAAAQPSGAGANPTAAAQDEQQLQRLPAVGPDGRAAAALLSEAARWDAAVDLVAQLGDPQAAARVRVERNNWYRLQRVLQILVMNGGQPLSELDINTQRALDFDFRCFFLNRPRLQLFDRIVYRVEEMVAGGLLPEALMLLDQGLTPNSTIATRAIGYRQATEFLQTALQRGGATKQQLQQLILDIATASRGLVRSQTTWFRDEDMFRWVEVADRPGDDVLAEVLAELAKPCHQGGCGDSGRLDKATQNALKRYVPTLRLDEARIADTLAWVAGAAAARRRAPTAETGVEAS